MAVQAEPLIASMESLCLCPVCYSNFNETTRIAQMLHCGHTFCSQCVENVQKYGNSAHLECPSCRAETKCDAEKVGTNFLVMEMIRKMGLMGPNEIAPAKEPKRARKEQRERTIDEMIDESYRQLIADVKSELMSKFEELRDGLRKSTIQSVQSELEDLSECILGAVRDAYDGLTDSEGEDDDEQQDEEEQEEDTSIQLESARDSDGESVMIVEVSSRNGGNIFQRAFDRFFRRRRNTPSPTSSVIIVENPMRSSEESNSSDSSSSSSSSPSTSSGDESDDEENEGMDGMEAMSIEWTSDDEEEDEVWGN
ncbi:hypothetical protein L3Y34_014181 [Caenorhabditis briggsae]|uniref:RING-type domain-containing protein n=1 Tax=Caenorhabditis briggsae TaxID=6238 RepID=A0AAE9DS70_CAEBR|nr:hypothetical protein L3Y34_014181 [Caenorhabditis briggsae]